MANELRFGQMFKIYQRLKQTGIPFISTSIYTRDGNRYIMFKANTWAVKKSQHPFNGCNPDFTLWDSQIKGTAQIAFKIY